MINRNDFPMHIANSYYKNIRYLMKLVNRKLVELFRKDLAPLSQKYIKEVNKEIKANQLDIPEGARGHKILEIEMLALMDVSNVLLEFEKYLNEVFDSKTIRRLANQFVGSIVIDQKRRTVKEISRILNLSPKKVLSINIIADDKYLEEFVDRSIALNVSLIKTIPEQYFERVEKAIKSGFLEGKLTKDIGKDLQEIYDITDRRSQFIARDQVASINGNITKERQDHLGLESFVWFTVQDERVRESHDELNRRIFSWQFGAINERGETIWPGTDFNCRCTAGFDEQGLKEKFEGEMFIDERILTENVKHPGRNKNKCNPFIRSVERYNCGLLELST